ncbi:CRISPR-associated endoribonuclease Cas6 [Herpetosiphon llansteffanensis]|uniref:CRISPR-associated endoribonuclease Cas6 n=1 Tax=Herpetosiphon llansteffanensis TaxID=2094568 RepID=UPI000D7C062E|nr:CRISPR-associated endoribonuclease Cas6 [Herpetosiphon llansteffanensis]
MLAQPELIACVLELTAAHGTQLERTQGHRAHALFLELIKASDPALSEQLHAASQTKPWTVTPLPQQARRLHNGESYPLRVAFLQANLYWPFAQSFLQRPQQQLRLGSSNFKLHAIHTTSQDSAWAGTSTWQTLVDQAQASDEVTLWFATPTCFKLGRDRTGKQRIGVLPDGQSVFQSLLRRWNAFAPTPLASCEQLEQFDIQIKRYQLHTDMLHAQNKQLGFLGKVCYKLAGDLHERRILTTLADAAMYLGVGAKTTQGMGLVQRLKTKQQEQE